MEKIAFIVDHLNQPPFRKGIATMTELDSKHGSELFDLACEVIVEIDPDQEPVFKEPAEYKVHRVMQFLRVMKFNIPEDHYEDFQSLVVANDKEVLYTIMHWCLQRFEHLKKRAYLAKFLMPLDIPAEFLNEELVVELSQRLKELQMEFKEVHKEAEQVRSSGVKPADLKQEIQQLEQERTQLQNKIQRMKKDSNVDEDRFKEMLKATSALRKEQETEVLNHERLREHRKAAQEVEMRFNESNRRFNELRSSGIQNQSAEQILTKLQSDVKELEDRSRNLERIIEERQGQLDKLQSWDSPDRAPTEDDVFVKRDEVSELQQLVAQLNDQMDAAMEKNKKLEMFRPASVMALKKLREREEELEMLNAELRRINRQVEEKEQELRLQSRNTNSNKITKKQLKAKAAEMKDKMETYKRMRDELAALRSELVVLQRTEQVLKSRDQNLEQFLTELEKQKGVEGYRDTQRAIVEMTEKAAEIDQVKGATLEEISAMVEQISREFRNKQTQLQPLIGELKSVRQDYLEVESQYQEKKSMYDKVAIALDMEKQALEKECNQYQDEALREESRYFQLQNLISILKIRLDRCEMEKKWQSGKESMTPHIKSLKDLYAQKLTQQEFLTKQLRKRKKELEENAGALTNQKTNFTSLQILLDAKNKLANGESINTRPPLEVLPTAYAEPIHNYGGGADVMSFDQKDYY